MSEIPQCPSGLRYNSQTQSLNATGAAKGFPKATTRSPELEVVAIAMRDFVATFLEGTNITSDLANEFGNRPMNEADWTGLSRKVFDSMRKAHFLLVRDDAEYTQRLGEAIVSYERGVTKPNKKVKVSASSYRYRSHELVKDAIEEGVPTIGAVFAVVPNVVCQQYPDLDADEKMALAYSLLPSAESFSFGIGGHGKDLNEEFIDATRTNSFGPLSHAKYKELRYDPASFRIELGDGELQLRMNSGWCPIPEAPEPFAACPALAFGSINKTAQIFSSIIREGDLYANAIQTITSSADLA